MIKKTVTYTDFNGNRQTEELYFHVTPSEWVGRAIGEDRTFAEKVQEVTHQGREMTLLGTPEGKHMLELFEDIILGAYGVRSNDGKRFVKAASLREDFKQTSAYDQLFIDLILDPVAMAAFIEALIPPEIRAAVDAKPAPSMSSRTLEEIGKTDQAELNAITVPPLPTPVLQPAQDDEYQEFLRQKALRQRGAEGSTPGQ